MPRLEFKPHHPIYPACALTTTSTRQVKLSNSFQKNQWNSVITGNKFGFSISCLLQKCENWNSQNYLWIFTVGKFSNKIYNFIRFINSQNLLESSWKPMYPREFDTPDLNFDNLPNKSYAVTKFISQTLPSICSKHSLKNPQAPWLNAGK
jgi:hypothetical protein